MMRALVLILIIVVLTVDAARAGELKIATWNLNWLTTRTAGLPADVQVRVPEDFERLRAYAAELNADVVAIQEVDSREVAQLVFPRDLWSVHLTRDRVRQRVGIVVRRGIPYDVNPDITAIALDPMARLRSGADITIHPPGGSLRILTLHLKQGCQYLSLGPAPKTTCLTLLSQLDVVNEWIAARRDEGAAFIVLGDFNRGMEKRDPFIRKIQAVTPVTRATEGYGNPCWGNEPFIDHILIGGPARRWVMDGSLRVLTYLETDPSWKARLSDHCPVSVRLALPDQGE